MMNIDWEVIHRSGAEQMRSRNHSTRSTDSGTDFLLEAP